MTTTAPRPAPSAIEGPGARPLLDGERTASEQLLVKAFVVVPLLALLAAVPLAWGWGLSWTDVGLAVFFYFLSGLGITVGFHRHFTHRAFKATRALKIGLAVAGSMAFQGPIIHWVADHRRHHAFTDKEGDPHSPWLFGTSPLAVAKGFVHAHLSWLFARDKTNAARFAPDLLADRDLRRVHRQFIGWSLVSLAAPALLGGVITWSWWGAVTGLFWAGLVRLAVLNHVTWSINSICHMIGSRPFTVRDRSTNFWPLAIVSMGESWHNFHHADPTCARHGVRRGQLDMSAWLIAIFEKLGWAYDIRWPTPRRLGRLTERQQDEPRDPGDPACPAPAGERAAPASSRGWLGRIDRPMTAADIRTHGSHLFMTVVEIAAMMRVSRATVYRLLHAGHLPSIRVGRCLRVPRQAVETYVRSSTLHSFGI